MIKFECHAKRPDGERLYRLIIDGETVREHLTIDDVVRAINDRDEARLGADHAPRTPSVGCAAGFPCRGAEKERKNRK